MHTASQLGSALAALFTSHAVGEVDAAHTSSLHDRHLGQPSYSNESDIDIEDVEAVEVREVSDEALLATGDTLNGRTKLTIATGSSKQTAEQKEVEKLMKLYLYESKNKAHFSSTLRRLCESKLVVDELVRLSERASNKAVAATSADADDEYYADDFSSVGQGPDKGDSHHAADSNATLLAQVSNGLKTALQEYLHMQKQVSAWNITRPSSSAALTKPTHSTASMLRSVPSSPNNRLAALSSNSLANSHGRSFCLTAQEEEALLSKNNKLRTELDTCYETITAKETAVMTLQDTINRLEYQLVEYRKLDPVHPAEFVKKFYPEVASYASSSGGGDGGGGGGSVNRESPVIGAVTMYKNGSVGSLESVHSYVSQEYMPEASMLSESSSVWIEQYDVTTGRTYYYNSETGVSEWEKPEKISPEKQASKSSPARKVLPDAPLELLRVGDWLQQFDADGHGYWLNVMTGASEWSIPPPARVLVEKNASTTATDTTTDTHKSKNKKHKHRTSTTNETSTSSSSAAGAVAGSGGEYNNKPISNGSVMLGESMQSIASSLDTYKVKL